MPLTTVHRYAYVDLLRGICALAVLICHYQWFYARSVGDFGVGADLPLDAILWPVYRYGGLAVQVFWALSGFVFAMAYGRFGKQIPLAAFWRHRFARLYPLHLATLCLIAALQIASLAANGEWVVYGNNDWPHFAAQIFLASNWFTQDGSFNGPIWSVSLEVVIYVVFLVYMRLFGLRLTPALAIAFVCYIATRVPGTLVPMCGALFFLGVILAIVLPAMQRRAGRALPWLALAGLAGMAGGAWLLSRIGHPSLANRIGMFGLIPGAVLLFASFDTSFKALPARYHWIGAVTYAVYLLHMPLVVAVKLVAGDQLYTVLPSPLALFAFIGAVVGLSLLVHRYFEMPMQYVLRRPLRAVVATPAAITAAER